MAMISERRRHIYTAIAVVVLGVITGLVIAFFPGGETPSDSTPSGQATVSAADGSKIFSANCTACHGKNREGVPNLGPPLNPETLAELTDTEIEEVITGGRLPKGMPPFGEVLSAGEIEALRQFIKDTTP